MGTTLMIRAFDTYLFTVEQGQTPSIQISQAMPLWYLCLQLRLLEKGYLDSLQTSAIQTAQVLLLLNVFINMYAMNPCNATL